jgi:hypothetical protein
VKTIAWIRKTPEIFLKLNEKKEDLNGREVWNGACEMEGSVAVQGALRETAFLLQHRFDHRFRCPCLGSRKSAKKKKNKKFIKNGNRTSFLSKPQWHNVKENTGVHQPR